MPGADGQYERMWVVTEYVYFEICLEQRNHKGSNCPLARLSKFNTLDKLWQRTPTAP